MSQFSNIYSLEERVEKFGESVILFCRILQITNITGSIINQVVRSATSVGANYMEANNASSPRDFKNKIYICKKEAQETKHWFRMLKTAVPERKNEIDALYQEAHELTLIFQTSINTMNAKAQATQVLKNEK